MSDNGNIFSPSVCNKLFVEMLFEPWYYRLNFGNDPDQPLQSGSRIKKSLMNNTNVHLGIRLNILSQPLSQLIFMKFVHTLFTSNAATTLKIMKRY